MSEPKPVINWHDMLRDETNEGAEIKLITVTTRGIFVAGMLALGLALHRVADKAPDRNLYLNCIHLAAVSCTFGTTVWGAFIAGNVMARDFPRHMFGHLQSHLLPVFFNYSMTANAISLATFICAHPRGTWGHNEKIQLLLTGTSFGISIVSALIITPLSINAMWQMYREEQRLGESGMQIGSEHPNANENPEFARLHRIHTTWRVVRRLVNFTGLFSTSAHIWYLGSRLQM